MTDQQESAPQIAEVHGCSGHVKRDGFVDSWRGIFHIILLLDHLPYLLPTAFAILGDFLQPLGYVSVAEGFVFVSGFMSGLVYTRARRERGDRIMWRKAVVRAAEIYVCYVLAVVLLVAFVKCGGESCVDWGSWAGLIAMSLPVAAAKSALLLYQPAFLEILPMYCLFLLGTPILIKQLEKKRCLLVLMFSLSIWVIAQFNVRNILLNLTVFHQTPLHHFVHFGYFNSLGWQIFFVSGLLCGHKTFTAKTPWLYADWRLPALAYIVTQALFVLRHNLLGLSVDNKWVDGSSLGPLRLLNFVCITFLICRFRRHIEKYIAWRGFALLSKHSLQVFAFHLFPIYLAAIVIGGKTSLPILAKFLVVGFCFASLFLIAFLAQLFKQLRSWLVDKWQNIFRPQDINQG
jgi:hypothetical protein